VGDWQGFDWDGDGNPDNLINELQNQVLDGNDVLIVRTANTREDLVLNAFTPATSASLTFTTATGIPDGAIVIVANCNRGDMFQNNPGGGGGNAAALTRAAAGNPGNIAGTNFSQDYFCGPISAKAWPVFPWRNWSRASRTCRFCMVRT